MKKLLLLCFTIIPVLAFSQKAKIEFEKHPTTLGKSVRREVMPFMILYLKTQEPSL